MKSLLHWCRHTDRGVAAVEFAVTFPILLWFLAGVTDFGIVYFRQSCLSSALAAAAQYASLVDVNTPPVVAANVQTVLQNAAAQAMPNVAVTATVTGPACYCLSGASPNTTLTALSCGGTCSSGGAPGKYIFLQLQHNYNAIFPILSMMNATTTLTKKAWVPLQ